MRLPNTEFAVVEREKITEYLLNPEHRYGASKARFFAGFGFTLEACDVLASALRSGDVGTVVHIHNNGEGYEVEFMTLTGQTIALASLLALQVRPVSRQDVSC